MPTYDDTNTGTLAKNQDKDGSREKEKWSDYKGRLNINGQWHYLDAWLREGRNGKFMSLKLGKAYTPRNQQRNASSAPADTVNCVGPNGESLTLSRDVAVKLGLRILDAPAAPPADFDDDVPF